MVLIWLLKNWLLIKTDYYGKVKMLFWLSHIQEDVNAVGVYKKKFFLERIKLFTLLTTVV